MNRRLCSSFPRPSRIAAEKTLSRAGLSRFRSKNTAPRARSSRTVSRTSSRTASKQRMSGVTHSARGSFSDSLYRRRPVCIPGRVAQTEAPSVPRWAIDSSVLDLCGTHFGRGAAPGGFSMSCRRRTRQERIAEAEETSSVSHNPEDLREDIGEFKRSHPSGKGSRREKEQEVKFAA